MLEARNLKKEYKTKNSPIVKALDDVSIKFNETGMVFILGKSGSGKSTLLNVLGGLDNYDSGEVIVKGKSSKDFSKSDFDSYRNTFVGFIFQEYNILEEFSVYKNIALALELQGKKANKEEVNKLIEQVDLKGLGKRKPNTLSGGQKQRVAIARALVKNPEIIMADEPTGALDSNTGKQVLDTLKKLSETKLVIIVSHDREFAEYYGDRIVELADGKIISDVSKYKSKPKLEEDLEIVDDKILTIRKGTKLDSKTTLVMKKFMESSDSDIIISIDRDTNKELKKFARIDDEGNKESFKDTELVDTKEYDPKKFKLLRSKLPGKDSFKMGASSLKVKPFRLFMTILLSAISFCLFGLADTLGSYDKNVTTINSMMDANVDYAAFTKGYNAYSDSYYDNGYLLTKKESNEIKDKFKELDFYDVYREDAYSGIEFSSNVATYGTNGGVELYKRYFSGYSEIKNNLTSIGKLMVGNTLPQALDEVVITKYSLQAFINGGYVDYSVSSEKIEITSANDIVGKTIVVGKNNQRFKIVNVIDTNINLDKYKPLNETTNMGGINEYMLNRELDVLINNSFHSVLFVYDGYCDRFAESTVKLLRSESIEHLLGRGDNQYTANIYKADYLNDNNKNNIAWVNQPLQSLAPNQIVLNLAALRGYEIPFKGTSFTFDGDEYTMKNIQNNMKDMELSELLGVNIEDDKYIQRVLDYYENRNTLTDPDNIRINASGDYYIPIFNEYRVYKGDDSIKIVGNDVYLSEEKIATIENNEFTYNDLTYYLGEDIQGKYIQYNAYQFDFISYSQKDLDKEVKEKVWNYLDNYKPLFVGKDELYKKYFTEEKINELYNARDDMEGVELIHYKNRLYEYVVYNWKYDIVFDEENKVLDELNKEYYRNFLNFINNKTFNLKLKESDGKIIHEGDYELVGLYYGDVYSESSSERLVISNDLYSKISVPASGNIATTIAKIDTSNKDLYKKLVEFNYTKFGKIKYGLENVVTNTLSDVNSLIEDLSKVFFYIGIGFAVFSSVLLLNFISISISNKIREVGVLRAIGARGRDIFKIFFNEAFLIATINFIVAFIGSVFVCMYLNNMIMNEYNFPLSLLNIGIRQVILMFGVSLIVAFIAAYLPVIKVARKKPIEVIKG